MNRRPEHPATATFAAGCFWGVEAAFAVLTGVVATRVGYTGGTAVQPTYQEVCGGCTGHAEAVEVRFDPAQISYAQLLAAFWECHDPTTLNRQGPDAGSQYRSVIFYHDKAQRQLAEQSKEALAAQYAPARIVTEIVPAVSFYPAEEYHQQYVKKRGLAHCHFPASSKEK